LVELVLKENMMRTSLQTRRPVFNPNARGYHAVYHDGDVNHCPGCGRTHWIIGRLSAECAFCSTALPLKDALTSGPAPTPVFWSGTRPSYAELNAA
jgi:hypothetical protein